MQAIHAENISWTPQERGIREAVIFSDPHGTEQTRVVMMEIPPGAYLPAHRHNLRREFLTIVYSAGAQVRLGERIFRPTAGQVFHREPGDVLALTNDTPHPFRYTVTQFRYQASDLEWLAGDEVAASST
jgi:quercetin dioxygenase-like cupin family protein